MNCLGSPVGTIKHLNYTGKTNLPTSGFTLLMTNAMDTFLSVRLQSRSSGKSLKEHILNCMFSVREVNEQRIINPQI